MRNDDNGTGQLEQETFEHVDRNTNARCWRIIYRQFSTERMKQTMYLLVLIMRSD